MTPTPYRPPAVPTHKHSEPDLSPLELIDDDDGPQPVPVQGTSTPIAAAPTIAGESKIRAFGVADVTKHKENWSRKTHMSGTGACRVRSFHGKLSDQGLAYLDDAINEWLDNHPDVEVKFVTSTVGTFEGKMREPALILNLWY